MSAASRTVVLGAGIIGSCCALRLQAQGHEVVLIDREPPGFGCSFGNAGALSPSASIPMALPGMLKKVPKWLFDPLGPLSVRWSYLLRAAPWLAQWVLASRPAVATRASHALDALNRGTLDGYRELLRPAQYDDLIKPTGQLYVWRKRPDGPGDRLAQALREAHGIRTEQLGADELRQIEPRLAPDITAGLLLPDNSQTRNPQRLVETLADNFVQMGGRFLRDEVVSIDHADGRPASVRTRTDTVPFDTLIVAAGAFSTRLLGDAAPRVPLETERGYHMMLTDPDVMPRLPIMFGDYKFYATPMELGLRLAGTVEFAAHQAGPNWRRPEALLANARTVLPGLTCRGSTVWMGRRPSIPDSVPVIDRSPRFPNVYMAFGHGHLGMSGGPGTSRLVSDLVAGRTPFIDPRPYSALRFGLAKTLRGTSDL